MKTKDQGIPSSQETTGKKSLIRHLDVPHLHLGNIPLHIGNMGADLSMCIGLMRHI